MTLAAEQGTKPGNRSQRHSLFPFMAGLGATFWAEAKLDMALSLCKVALEWVADSPANDAW